MTEKHTPISGSVANIVINCPMYIGYAEFFNTYFTKQVKEKNSERGICLHQIMHKILTRPPGQKVTKDYMYSSSYTLDNPEEEFKNISTALNWTREAVKYIREISQEKVNFLSEASFEYKDLPGSRGTADLVLYNEKVLVIIDYKFGTYPVSTKDNKQLLFYLASALDSEQFANKDLKCFIGVIQPSSGTVYSPQTTASPTNIFRIEEVDKEKIAQFKQDLRKSYDAYIENIKNIDYNLANPGDWCKYALCTGICPKQKEKVQNIISKKTELVTDEELVTLLEDVRVVSSWLNSAQKLVDTCILNNKDIPGYTITPGRKKPRKYLYEGEELLYYLKGIQPSLDEQLIVTKSILSPAKLVKLQREKKFEWDYHKFEELLAPVEYTKSLYVKNRGE